MSDVEIPEFVPVPGWALAFASPTRPAEERISAFDVLVLGTIAYFCRRHDAAYPSMRTLAGILHVTERTVSRSIATLEAHGLLKVARSRGRGHLATYELILPAAENPSGQTGITGASASAGPENPSGWTGFPHEKPSSETGFSAAENPSGQTAFPDENPSGLSGQSASRLLVKPDSEHAKTRQPGKSPLLKEKKKEKLTMSAPPPASPPRGKPRGDDSLVREVFEYWRTKLGKSERAKLDGTRRRRIEWALAHYGPDDAKRCIDGYSQSPYHLGQNERRTRYDDLELWFRNASHFERGLAYAERAPTKASSTATTKGYAGPVRARRDDSPESHAAFERQLAALRGEATA